MRFEKAPLHWPKESDTPDPVGNHLVSWSGHCGPRKVKRDLKSGFIKMLKDLDNISNTSENEWYLSLDSQIPWMKSIFSSHRRENIDFMNGIWLFKLRYHEFSDVLFLCTLTQHRHPGYLLFRSGYLLLCSGYLLFSNRQGGYLLFSHCRTMLQQVYRNVSLQHGPAVWSLKKIASWV